jgi:hypothetical protein
MDVNASVARLILIVTPWKLFPWTAPIMTTSAQLARKMNLFVCCGMM